MPVNFDDLTNRILDRLDAFEVKFDITCANISQMKTDLLLLTKTVDSHLNETKAKASNKEKRVYYVLGLMAIVLTGIEIFRGF